MVNMNLEITYTCFFKTRTIYLFTFLGKNEARANFRLKINHVTDSMLENAVTLRIANVSATDFLSPFYEYLIEGLSVVVPCHKSQIHIFSLKDDDEDPFTRVLNVTFSVSVAGTHNEDYLKSDYIKERVYLQYNLLKKLLLLQILPFDDNICVREPCLNYETCSSQMKIANTDENNGEPLKGLSLLFRYVFHATSSEIRKTNDLSTELL